MTQEQRERRPDEPVKTEVLRAAGQILVALESLEPADRPLALRIASELAEGPCRTS